MFTGFLVMTMLAVFFGFQSIVSAATTGQPLTSPESGWKRYDDTNGAFIYNGTFSQGVSNQAYKGKEHLTNVVNDKITFEFKGTQLRILAGRYPNRSDSIEVYLNGTQVSTLTQNGTHTGQVLIYEVLDLPETVHSVEIINKTTTSNTYMSLDAIDINSNGYLISDKNIFAESGDSSVNLTWDSFLNAQSYKVLRSTTPGGPYTEVGSSNTNSYVDNDVINGITYYYTILAVNNYSEAVLFDDEVSATPYSIARAILTIYIEGGQVKEYDLSSTELNSFLDWYDEKDIGVGPARYGFVKSWNKGPFIKRTDFVIFDKILTFEVSEYSTEN